MNDEPRGEPVPPESRWADAMREGAVDAEGVRRAVAAFRAARDAGRHRARTRDRDDWRHAHHDPDPEPDPEPDQENDTPAP
ncbi:hypothetical protein ACIPJQ_23105 [Streptomyces griseoviridis]